MMDWFGSGKDGNTLRVRACPGGQRCRMVHGRYRMVTIKVHHRGMVQESRAACSTHQLSGCVLLFSATMMGNRLEKRLD
jgi:hypothetical protein